MTSTPEPGNEPQFSFSDEELARRAALLVRAMVRDAGRYLSRVDFGELNSVMFEAEQRGWYRDA